LNILLGVLFLLSSCFIGQAQSGRRAPKPVSPPMETPSRAEPEPTPTPQNKPALKQQKLIVGMDDRSVSLYVPLYMSDAVWRGFIERFKDFSSITITTDKNMSRKQAVDRAKKETESFVVLLQLGTEDIGAGMGQVNADELVVSYAIFTPGTGKVKDQGRVYARSYRGVLGTRLPTSRTGESQLHEAGRETAGRVMAALNIASVPVMH
jgi:hypothetical protein